MLRSRWITGVVAACVLALAVPAVSSAATYTGTATLAPIGTGSYLLTITNTGIAISAFDGLVADSAGSPTGVMTDAGTCGQLSNGFLCTGTIAVGASGHVCYNGSALIAVDLGIYDRIGITSAPATTCPLAGFTPAPPVTPAPVTPVTPAPVTPTPVTPTTPAAAPVKTPVKSAHTWKRALCVSTYKSWKSSHRHATAKQRRVEQSRLKTQHGCKASALK